MSTATATQAWTTQEFLAWERDQQERFEFDGFRAIAMTGARVRHALVVGNLRRAIESQLPAGCRVFSESLKLQCEGRIRYPDVMVTCHPLPDLDADIVDSAVFVAEVLSPSSIRTDRVEKVEDYASVPDLSTYLVVDPAVRDVAVYARTDAGLELVEATDPLNIGRSVRVTLEQIYDGVA